VTHAIVTGGSSGIGLALVRRLTAAGHRVSILALDDDDLARLRDGPPPGEHPVRVEAVDVADREQVEGAIARVSGEQGPCGLLVTCAGIVRPGRFLALDADEFERHLAVNYLGTLWAVRAVAPTMIARRSGSIAMVASFAGVLGVYGYSAYAPSKYAVRGLAETLRTELKPHGVHVACVFPTDVDTPGLAAEEPFKPPELRALSGTAATQSPDQVAAAILAGVARRRAWILGDRSSTVLARVAGAAPGIARRIVDHTVARAARGPGGVLEGVRERGIGGRPGMPV
jgi:3-dehydrosphinganine reductase